MTCPDGDHNFAPTFQWSWFGGSYHRPCLNEDCNVITLDPDPEFEDLCGSCIDGDHDDCTADGCRCIDMEHAGGRYGETDSINDRSLIP